MKYLLYIVPFLTFGQHLSTIPQENYVYPDFTIDYLESIINTQGKKVTKVSDSQAFEVTGQRLEHNYSTDQAWNCDGTLLKLAGYPAAILDGNTYEFLYWSVIPGYARWSNTNPLLMYGTSETKFVSHRVDTGERETIFDYGSDIDFGFGEGNQDLQDNYALVISATKLLVIDIQNKQIYSELPRIEGDLDWASVSPTGQYILISFRPNGSAQNQGLKKYNIDFTNETHLSDYTEHNAMGIVNGNEVIVQMGNPNTWNNDYYLEVIDLNTNVVSGAFYWTNGTGIWGGHLSIADNKVFINEGCCIEHYCLPNEIFSLDIQLNTIERFGKAHSSYSARASVNRTGTKIIYSSDFFGSERNAYIVESEATLSIEDNFPYLFATKKYYNVLGQEVNATNRGVYIVEYRYLNKVVRKKLIK